AAQLDLARQISNMMEMSFGAYNEVESLQTALVEREKSLAAKAQAKEAIDAAKLLEKELAEIKDGTTEVAGFGAVNRDLARFLSMAEVGDVRPAESLQSAARQACESLGKVMERWRKVNTETLPALNKLLKQNNLAPLPAPTIQAAIAPCS
ncbi:MAG TPA: hypothetical protein VGC64_06190, partial [Pyrinomonadaceae bacterium]